MEKKKEKQEKPVDAVLIHVGINDLKSCDAVSAK